MASRRASVGALSQRSVKLRQLEPAFVVLVVFDEHRSATTLARPDGLGHRLALREIVFDDRRAGEIGEVRFFRWRHDRGITRATSGRTQNGPSLRRAAGRRTADLVVLFLLLRVRFRRGFDEPVNIGLRKSAWPAGLPFGAA